MKTARIFLVVLLALTVSFSAFAKDKKYIYRHRTEWVKINELSTKQLAGQTLKHPYTISIPQLSAMLRSIQMNKGQFLKKGFKTSEVFSIEEAEKYAPYIVQALAQATPNQVVNVAVLHQRNYFIVRSDFISIINIFVADDGLHLYFQKLFAKMEGEYKQAALIDDAIRKAKSIRISMQAGPGQTLNADIDELILDLNYDWINNQPAVQTPVKDGKKTKADKKQDAVLTTPTTTTPAATATTPASTTKTTTTTTPANTTNTTSVESRLQTLEDLKNKKLITTEEYKQKKAEILNSL